jgi:FHA domain
MFSIKRICAVSDKQCCFISNDSEKSNSNINEEKSQNNITNQNELHFQSDKKPLKMSNSEFIKLRLIIVDSQELEIGKEYEINSNGLCGNTSRIKDGCVYGGSDPASNDIVLSQKEKGVGEKHFMIQYEKNLKNRFTIRDLGQGMGTFIRIDSKLNLKTNHIISFGDSHMIVNVDSTDTPKITLKFIDGPKNDEVL